MFHARNQNKSKHLPTEYSGKVLDKQFIKQTFKAVFVFLIVISWIFSGSSPVFNFPPKIQEVNAAGCSTAALGTGTDVAAATIAPGTAIADRGVFTITGSGTSCSVKVTALTVTLAASGTPYNGLAEVRITNSAGSTTYYSAVTSFASNNVSFSGGTTVPIGTAAAGAVTFKIRVTPLSHANMPAVPGASYAIAPYVSSWTTTLTKSGSDTNPNTTTIDNASPNGATSTSGSGGTGAVTLNWTTSNSSDFATTTNGSVVLRWAAASAGNAVPLEGTTNYVAGNTIVGGDSQTATVACVISSAASTAISNKVDGTSGSTGCNTSALSDGTSYSYRVFQVDINGNYDAGAAIGTFLTNPAAPTNAAATKTLTDKVTITWTKSTGATDYHVWRDSTDLGAAGDVATYDDTGAAAPTVTAGTASATDGSATDKVTLSISGASGNNGTSYTYKVVASNATGNSPDSATDTGYRVPGALTYQWNRSSGDADSGYSTLSGATTAPYDDATAPAPTITAGSASASDGTSVSQVALSVSGQSASAGAGRYFYATVSAAGAASADTSHDRGYIGVGSLTYQWQRSAADSDASYSNIAGATTASYNDTGAPADGSGRYFKVVEDAAGAAQQISTADRGYRAVAAVSMVTDGSVAFGFLADGAATTTTASGLNDMQTISVDSGPVNLDIKSTAFSDGSHTWALGAGNGANQVQWEFSLDGSSWTTFILADNYYTLDTNVAQGQTRNVYFRLTMPSSTTYYNQFNAMVTVLASAL